MPFVSVKCPNCGGDIELDASREFGFCLYCGAKVMFKEAMQKVEGNVTVEGIAGLEKMLANAKTFHNLGNQSKEMEVLTRVTENYPEDWRGWWRLAQIEMTSGHADAGAYGESDPYHLTLREQHLIADMVSLPTVEFIRNTLRLIPAKEAGSVKKATEQYWQSCLTFLKHEKEKLDNWFNYCSLTDRINQQSADQATAALEAVAEKMANEKVKTEMDKRTARISIIWLFKVGVQGGMSTFMCGLLISALLIIGIPAICRIYEKPTVPKPYRENYYKIFYKNALDGLNITKREEYYQEFLSAAWSTATSNPNLYKDFLVTNNSQDFKVEAQGLLYNCNKKIGQLTSLMNGIFPFPDAHYDGSVRQKVMAYMPQNQIVAVKTLRALTGLDFADAANMIDVWQAGFP